MDVTERIRPYEVSTTVVVLRTWISTVVRVEIKRRVLHCEMSRMLLILNK